MQVLEPREDLKNPIEQRLQGPPSEPVYPALHLQSVGATAPIPRVVALPTQRAHEIEPVEDLYWLGGQALHGLPSEPVYPALHLQSVEAVAPAANAELLTLHPKHAADPVAVLYCVLRHGLQGPPSDPVYPALHLQAVVVVLPVPAVVEFPVHSKHAKDPIEALYCPTEHGLHGPPSDPV